MITVIKKPFHLLVCLSSHGYGHFAMTAPILNGLREKQHFQLTLKTTLPENLLKSRIDGDFSIVSEASDFGMSMFSSLDVDVQKSAEAYRSFHQDYDKKVEHEAAIFRQLKPDLILVNVPYLSIDAAALCDIPCIAYCSLNWLDIFDYYFQGVFNKEAQIKSQMADAYNRADQFLCPAPSMPMPGLRNIRHIGPVAKLNTRPVNLQEKLNCDDQTRIVLITPGGVYMSIPVDRWPVVAGIVWLCSWPIKSSRPDIVLCEDIDLSFNEILANCDAVISKPGYGTVTETVCNDVPALYVKRGDWPEEPRLINWWQENGCIEEISREDLFSGEFINRLTLLWEKQKAKRKNRISPTGIEDACEVLSEYFPG